MWTLPPCTCPRDPESTDVTGCALHDPRGDWKRAFYAEALPCESCGEPTYEARQWNPEHQLWVAVDCGCNAPDMPVCPDLYPLLMAVSTVGEAVEVCQAHRDTCRKCGPVIEMPKRSELVKIREAA